MLLYPLLITIACFTDRISDDMQGSIQVKASMGLGFSSRSLTSS